MEKISIKWMRQIGITILILIVSGCTETTVPYIENPGQTLEPAKSLDTIKVPTANLEISAKATSGLIISHNGGDPLILKDETITIKINDKVVDGLNEVLLFGNTPEFQDSPAIATLSASQKIKHSWKESVSSGEVLTVTIQDLPTGMLVADTTVTVS